MDTIKPCPHPFCGCISQNGHMCMHGSECEPMDEDGRRFTIREWDESGTRMTARKYVSPIPNTYDNLEGALKDKGFWTPADERKPFGKKPGDLVGS